MLPRSGSEAVITDGVGRPLAGLLYSSAAPSVLAAAGDLVELLDVIPERLWYDTGPGSGSRFHAVDGAIAELEDCADGRVVTGHGIGLSLPSDMPLDTELLDTIANLHDRVDFAWYSEHLSSFATMRGAVPNAQAGLGLPVPYDGDVLDLLAAKVTQVQDRLGVRLLMENPALFTPVPDPEMSETQFLNELAARTGCGILLDLHNHYANVRNELVDADEYLAALDLDQVVEIHLAGGSELFGTYTDSHAELTPSAVWEMADTWAPSMPSLGAIVFEFHESAVDRLGVPALVDEMGRVNDLVSRCARPDTAESLVGAA